MSGLQISDLHKSFGANPVLTGVDLEVPAGSLMAILGPSGSGKTTLLRLLAGFEMPDRGTVTIDGQVVDTQTVHVRSEHRKIGYVPQEGGLFPHLTVQANVAFGLARPERRRGVGELLDMVGLTDLARRYPHQLSGGQQQRVALARALAIRPAVVLLDEPFSSLDASLRVEVRRDVARILAETDTTTVLVTHDQDEALALADQIAMLTDGRILACADPRELYGDPPDIAAAASIGEINILVAEIRSDSADCALGTVALRRNGQPSAEGASRLLLRPEQLALHVTARADTAKATVTELQYHGHDALVYLTLEHPGHEQLLARIPGELALTPGQQVWVQVTGPGLALPG